MGRERMSPLATFSYFFTLLPAIILLISGHASRTSLALDSTNDTQTLLTFKASADIQNSLISWSTSDCCSPTSLWAGVTCHEGRVSRLSLRGFNLRGSIEPLSHLSKLRVLVISDNNIHGPLPNLTNWRLLWLLNLSSNQLSGPIPPSIASLTRLWRLDLSQNFLNGSIPGSIGLLTRLLTLHLHNNALTGKIPPLTLPSLMDLSLQYNNLSGNIPPLYLANLSSFDASFNNLSGPIPVSLAKFAPSAFLGNVNLCGGPLQACNQTNIVSNPAAPMSDVPSNPSTLHPEHSSTYSKASNKLSFGAIIAIVIGDVIILLLLALIFVVYYWKRGYSYVDDCKKSKVEEDMRYLPSLQAPDTAGERNKLIFFNDVKRFELEDLLRASAEMLGKGSFGTTYKAVLEDGYAVSVKRLKDMNPSGKREFEQHMELIGRLDHPNVLPLRAYYSAKDEKLLVYDYMLSGSLHNILHGNKGPGRVPLDWAGRVKIAFGAARGLAYLHEACSASKIPHGNIKSSNILVDKHGNACIADFGLTLLTNPATIAARLLGYRAPEQIESKKVTQKGDVYSYGVVLLEVLTGRVPAQALQDEGVDLPRWVQSVVREEWTAEVFDLELMRFKHIEEHLVSLLQIAMACVSPSPDQRPSMPQVASMIQDLSTSTSPAPAAYSPSPGPSPSPSSSSH
ncbi:hypothetical protein GOP47_0015636 [Adiantum capillus-veneris]|uniref:Protein kinase domain-containing protein n=1 Tax=Adiantum capillus-veneris TaxID=13818 RepID=A0A9D4UK52_ADICA|nr:hypothetical protein GOP47_0015636 [Adiantum capillus-veneris]